MGKRAILKGSSKEGSSESSMVEMNGEGSEEEDEMMMAEEGGMGVEGCEGENKS